MAARRGIDKITLDALTARAKASKEAFAAHLKDCYTCHSQGKGEFNYCDLGWALSKAANRDRNTRAIYLGTYADGPLDGQLELF